MSSHRKLHNDRAIIYITIGIIILVIFLGLFGLNALIGSSLLINNLTNSKEIVEQNTENDFFWDACHRSSSSCNKQFRTNSLRNNHWI